MFYFSVSAGSKPSCVGANKASHKASVLKCDYSLLGLMGATLKVLIEYYTHWNLAPSLGDEKKISKGMKMKEHIIISFELETAFSNRFVFSYIIY